MATDLQSTDRDVKLTRFWGGQDRGTCVQITTDWQEHVSLTREQALRVAQDLILFAHQKESEDRG